jgi:beta-galactosidase/beta-glucuronidase
MNLNGEWEFAFDPEDTGLGRGWGLGLTLERRIIVPYPYQSELSRINDKSIHEIIWYARDFAVPKEWLGRNLLLHFGAVDYECTVWVNGQEVGHNQGGHTPFYFNIAAYVNPGSNRLTLRVLDSQTGAQPRGKQEVNSRSRVSPMISTTTVRLESGRPYGSSPPLPFASRRSKFPRPLKPEAWT